MLIVLFGFSIILTSLMTPTKQALLVNGIDLESAISSEFDDWRALQKNQLQVINPEENTLVDKLYSQILERTYVNASGVHVMLSIAYGTEQRKDMLAHFPEVCYPAQGFNIDLSEQNKIQLLGNEVEVKFLKTQKGKRKEDITYWVRVGDKVVATRTDQKLEAILYGVKGIVPDGLIFRVSTIGILKSKQIHQDFINDLLSSIDAHTKKFLLAAKLTS